MTYFVLHAETPASAVPQSLLDEALNIADGWCGEDIDWEDVWDRLDGFEMPDGSLLDITTTTGPAIQRIKRYVRTARKES